MLRPVLTLLILSLLTFFLGLGRQAITDSDESFYAEASREMVELGDWVTPHFNYEDRWQKPILYYTLTAATYLATGPSEFAARLWSALSGLGLVLVTWATARRFSLNAHGAWLAGAIVATCFGCFAMARAALPDLPLAFFTTACISAALRANDADGESTGPPLRAFWWRISGLAAGLGFLTKGPVAIVVPALVLLSIWWSERRTTKPSWRGIAIALIVAAIISLPWYLAMTLQHGSAYLQSFFLGDNLERFATARFNDRRPIWFYGPVVLGGMLPWSSYLGVLLGTSCVDVLRRRRHLSRDEWRLLLWVGLPLVLFALSVGQQPRYILPLLPPLSIALARSLDRRIGEARGGTSRSKTLVAATWLTTALLGFLAVLLVRSQPLFISAFPWVAQVGAVMLGATSIALAAIAIMRAWHLLIRVTIVAAVTLLLTIQFGALAGLRPEPVENIAALVRAHRSGTEPVGQYRVFARNLVFYTRVKQVGVYDDEQALNFLRSSERVLLVLNEEDLRRLQSASGLIWPTLGRFEYLNTANLRVGDVLWPNPAECIDTVVLIANK